jgi:hypothetical protein
VLGWSLMGGRSKVLVASSSAAAASHQEPIAGFGEIVQHFAGAGIIDDRSNRNRQLDRFAFPPAPIAALAMPASLGGVFRIEAEVKQGVVVFAGDENDVTAAAPISAARPSARHVLLATERQTAVAAIPGLYADFNFIDKHGGEW